MTRHATTILLCALLLAAGARPVLAQTTPFQILDNSFFVEEAFNQERGVVQTIFGVHAVEGGDWEVLVTQEWPLVTERHQVSFSIPYAALDGQSGLGDVQIHYRWQASAEGDSRPAFSPRVTLLLQTGDSARGLGDGSPGWEVNLPFSKQHGDTYLHWNAGFRHTPSARIDETDHNLFTPHAAVSAIWRMRPLLNLMLESVTAWEAQGEAGRTRHAMNLTISPGLRAGWNHGDTQTVVGVAVPVTVAQRASRSLGVFGYLSYERPFIRRR